MKISKAEFTISAVSPQQYPEAMEPEIALVGRSNVGKSSLINKFVNRKSLARTSSQPGKTQTLNFYHINDSWYFVDLPGYGYARVSKEAHANWGRFINNYLEKRQQLAGIILLVDIRHPPSQDDHAMHEWLQHQRIPFLIVATKGDKIARGQWNRQKEIIHKTLETDNQMVVFSALSGIGLEEIQLWIETLIKPEEP